MLRGQCITYNHILVNRACSPSTSQKILAWSYFWNPSIINNTSSDHVATPAHDFWKLIFSRILSFSVLSSSQPYLRVVKIGWKQHISPFTPKNASASYSECLWLNFQHGSHEVICTTVRLLIMKSFWQPWHLERS